ncbi:hypothetical protein LNTAR_22889 [Lentisphaera araneosa HTCC2155]|jgi:hypothetical protein|uniref:Protein kinase domain-containing protein n=1 Tax=Lentisphaera araneosa HTCC2155 TaxID=313628 RepID=A6DGG9_9BACT|nr:protein kinase [Lentisphaera araneosa]EDM29286.1 hypothetical protein LNTAR_22889 [Lentisphaera araneosa HTCC2155]
MSENDTVNIPKKSLKPKLDKLNIELKKSSEGMPLDKTKFSYQETYDNLRRIDYMEKSKFEISITCANCGITSEYHSNELFEKVECPACKVKFRIPVETELFIYDKQVYESLFIHTFRAYNKENEFYGDVVVYEKLKSDASLAELQAIADEFKKFEHANYLPPRHVDVDESTYYFSRDNAPYRMNFYLASFGELPKERATHVLTHVCHLAANMAEHSIFGSFMPSDIMLDKDGRTLVCDYGLREKIHVLNPRYNYIPISFLAPEAIFAKVHTEASAVYSLGILAATFILGENPFSEKDPHQIHLERQNFLKNFEQYKLPSFLKKMLAYKSKDRPSFNKCSELFMRMQLMG